MKKYTVIVEDIDGHLKMNRTNDGFNPFEILGFLELAKSDIQAMIKGVKVPDEIVTKVIVTEEKIKES